MSAGEDYRQGDRRQLRVVFCFGVLPGFFEEDPEKVPEIIKGIQQAFDGLGERFGVKVLATMDDDELMVGPSSVWPWTAYVVADAPDLDAVTSVCNLVRETEVAGARLWKYMRVEARVGRELFFATS